VAVSGEEPMRYAAGSNFSLAIRSASGKVCNRRFAVAHRHGEGALSGRAAILAQRIEEPGTRLDGHRAGLTIDRQIHAHERAT